MAPQGYSSTTPLTLSSERLTHGDGLNPIILPRHILYIEDNAINQIYVQAVLEPMGYFVDVADDGASGLAMAARGQYQLILLDGRLPDLSGLEVLRRLRKLPTLVMHTPIIVISADVRPENTAAYLAGGADVFLPKPFRHEELLLKVASFDRQHA
jgi:CheY-like chemotaxis protein